MHLDTLTNPWRGGAVLLFVLLAAALLAASGCAKKSGLPGDFQIDAYRGADVLGGSSVRISSVIGHGRPVVINFFAGLCPPCRAEMPALQAVHDELADQFLLVGVDLGPYTGLGSNDEGRALVEDLNITFPTGSTPDGSLVTKYQVLGLPSTVFLMPDGTVYRKWDGSISADDMQRITGELIAASK